MPEGQTPIQGTETKKIPWYLSRATIFWGFLLLGPLALPLLWISPLFKLRARVLLTLAVVVLSYLSFKYTRILFESMNERVEEIQAVMKP